MNKTIVIAVALAALLSACGGGSGEGLDTSGRPADASASATPGAQAASFETIQNDVFTPICTVCHAGGSAPVGLKLDTANAYAMLVGVESIEVPGLIRVAPGDPDNSYLIQKLEGTASVGGQMPLGGPPLDTATIASIRQWITDGALPAGSSSPPTAAPTVSSVSPANDAVVTTVLTELSAAFSQPMDSSLVSDLTFTLIASGGDGTFGDGNETAIFPAAVTLVNAQSISMDLTGIALADDVYEARLVGSGATALADISGRVLDGDGDDIEGGDFTWRFTVSMLANAPVASWRWIQDNVFTPVCTQCHSPGGIAAFMLLDEQNSFISTVNVPSTEVMTLLRIASGDPGNSYLVQKLEGTAAVGDRMPLGGEPLAPEVIAAIRDWITAGVPLQPGDPMPPVPDVESPAVIIDAIPNQAAGVLDVALTATDNIAVTAARLFVDGVLVGSDTTAPFAISWDTTMVADGVHSLMAEAEDAAGNIGMSPVIDVSVANVVADNTPPQVSIQPINEPAVGVVTITVDATDNVAVASVEMRVDGLAIGNRTLPPYQFQWDTTTFGDGVHTLDAIAVDTNGNSAMATTLSVTVDNTLPPDTVSPVVAIATPPTPLTGTVIFQIDASDDTGVSIVRVFVDEMLIGSATTAPYAVSWESITVADGMHSLRAEAEDGAGNVGSSDTLTISVQNAAGAQPTWRWIQDNIFTTQCVVCHRQGGIADFLWLDEAASYDQLVNAPTTEGGPPLRVMPGDPDNSSLVQRLEGTLSPRMPLGGAALSPEQIQAVRQWILDGALPEVPVDTTPPLVNLVSPGSTVSSVITLTAEASDDTAVATVRFYINGQLAGSDSTAPYQYTWDTNAVADGNYELGAQADDTAGNTAVATTLTVAVDNSLPADTEPPTVSIQPPPGALSANAAITIDASDNVGVTLVSLSANGVLIGTDSTPPYTISWETFAVANGDYTLVATANDAADNSTMSTPVIVTVANTTPVITLELEVLPNVLRGDDFPVLVTINNSGAASPPLTATLTFSPPDAMRFEEGNPVQSVGILASNSDAVINWLMRADESGIAMITVTVSDGSGGVDIAQTVSVSISD